jgi:hypothetical protein
MWVMRLKDNIVTALTESCGVMRLKDNIATALTGSCGLRRLKGQYCYVTDRVNEVKGQYCYSTDRVMWGHEVRGTILLQH